MNGNYAKWLEKEKTWINGIEKKCKRDTWLGCFLTLAGCVVVLGAIGLLAAGINVQNMLQNMLIGFVAGIILIPFIFLLSKPTWPAKRYIKDLKTQIEDVLSPAEKEEFAMQMLGKRCEADFWINEEKREENVLITRDYVLRVSGRGSAVMVQLQKVQRVEVDVKEYKVTIRARGLKMQETATVYPMRFYYRKMSEGDKCDKEFAFARREDREQLSHILNEMKIGEQSL